MTARSASAVWTGDLKSRKGTMKLGSGAFEGAYSFQSRFEEGAGGVALIFQHFADGFANERMIGFVLQQGFVEQAAIPGGGANAWAALRAG